MIDVKKMTRAQAEKLVAKTDDYETLRQLAQHPNKHVGTKVAFKLLSPQDRLGATAANHFGAWLRAISGAEGGAA